MFIMICELLYKCLSATDTFSAYYKILITVIRFKYKYMLFFLKFSWVKYVCAANKFGRKIQARPEEDSTMLLKHRKGPLRTNKSLYPGNITRNVNKYINCFDVFIV